MSMGAGMAVGMGAGVGCGIAVGIGAGQEASRKKILEYADYHEMTVRDKAGKPVPWEDFLQEAIRGGNPKSSTAWILAILVGLVLALLAATFLFWRLSA